MPAAPTPKPRPIWFPFVVAGLFSTLTVGALSGAIDLWSLRVGLHPVPADHARGHAFAQLFGFLLLITMGLSLHLVPRFLSVAEASREWVRLQAWLAIGGVSLVIVGRLGALLPGTEACGIAGAIALTAAVARWLAFIFFAWLEGRSVDRQPLFLLAGTGWWFAATVLLLGWTLARSVQGPLGSLPLDGVWAAALFGGAGSWIFGIMLRAGVCVLRVERPEAPRQRVMLLGWQLVAASQVVAALWPAAARPLSALTAVGVAATLGALRPWIGALGSIPGEAFVRRMVQAALLALAGWAVLQGLAAVTSAPPALLADASRHLYTLGFATLMVFGFGGRMVPGFSGAGLASPATYTTGALAVMASVLLRQVELWPSRLALALSGSSGLLAVAGVLAMTGCLAATLLVRRREPQPIHTAMKVSV